VSLFWIHFAFPLVVDTYVLQPPIATSGETASASQVLPKGPVVGVCWCTIRSSDYSFILSFQDESLLDPGFKF
jgi:hypothetical protein